MVPIGRGDEIMEGKKGTTHAGGAPAPCQREEAELAEMFNSVWYRSRPLTIRDVTIKGMEDRGTLTVDPGSLRFEGKKGTVEITDIRRVFASRAGRDFVNRWITVEYGDGQTAMFVDGRLMGWRGIFGGNKKLLAAIEQAAGKAPPELS